MPYSADISRSNPGCFLFLVDRSGSMTGHWLGSLDSAKWIRRRTP